MLLTLEFLDCAVKYELDIILALYDINECLLASESIPSVDEVNL